MTGTEKHKDLRVKVFLFLGLGFSVSGLKPLGIWDLGPMQGWVGTHRCGFLVLIAFSISYKDSISLKRLRVTALEDQREAKYQETQGTEHAPCLLCCEWVTIKTEQWCTSCTCQLFVTASILEPKLKCQVVIYYAIFTSYIFPPR